MMMVMMMMINLLVGFTNYPTPVALNSCQKTPKNKEGCLETVLVYLQALGITKPPLAASN